LILHKTDELNLQELSPQGCHGQLDAAPPFPAPKICPGRSVLCLKILRFLFLQICYTNICLKIFCFETTKRKLVCIGFVLKSIISNLMDLLARIYKYIHPAKLTAAGRCRRSKLATRSAGCRWLWLRLVGFLVAGVDLM